MIVRAAMVRAGCVRMMAGAVIALLAVPAGAEPYPMESSVTIPVTAEVIGTDEVINCAMTADGLPEGCEIVEPASGEEE